MFENVARLTGKAADDRTARKMMFMAWRFAPLVKGYKMIKSYHAGDGVWVEIDVLMDEKAPLRKCHDIAETLQYCTEGRSLFVALCGDDADSCTGLKEVDRAFVTMDCKCTCGTSDMRTC
jgi:hypothetical protein